MRRSALPRARNSAFAARAVALGAVAALTVVGLPVVAQASHNPDDKVHVTSTNGLAVSSAQNTATVPVVISTNSEFSYATSPVPVAPTITFTRTGAGGADSLPATITSGASPSAKSFTLSVPLTSANPGTYDITVSGQTVPPGTTTATDSCSGCFTVLSAPPSISSISPTAIAQGAAMTFVVTGSGFAKGNYKPTPNSNYACAACTGAPLLEVRAPGGTTRAAGFDFSDPLNGASPPAPTPVPATATTITKRLAIAGSVTKGLYDVYVRNTNGADFTLSNALTVDPVPAISPDGVSAQSSVAGAPAGNTLGQGSTGGTITVRGADFPADITGSISYPGTSSDISYGFVRASPTQVRFTNVAPGATAGTGPRTITLRSPGNGGEATNTTSFRVSEKPVPATVSLLDTSGGTGTAYGRGATSVRVKVTGTAFVAGTNATGTQLVFAPTTGLTVESQSATTTEVTAVVTVGQSAPLGTAAVTVTAQNPDGGLAGCSTACTFGVNAAPQITGVTPNSEGRGQKSTVALVGTNLADGTKKTAPTVTIGAVGAAPHGAVTAASATSVSVADVVASTTAVGPQDVTLVNMDDKGRTTCAGCFTITTLAVTGTSNGSGLNTGSSGDVNAVGYGFEPTATVSLVKTGAGSTTVPSIPGAIVSRTSAGNEITIRANYNLAGVDPGTYAYQVTNPAGSSFPGVGQGGVFNVVAGAPTITSVAPASRGAGAVNQTIVLTGTNFGPNASVTFSNAKVRIDSTVRESATRIVVMLHIDPDATTGAGTVTVTNTDTQSVSSSFTVVPGPQVSSVSPSSRGQGAANTTLTLAGTQGSFPTAPNTSLTFVGGTGVSATGFTVTTGAPGPVPPSTPDTLTATLTVAGAATVGDYDVVLKDNSTGGQFVCTGCFTVHAKPTLTSVAPAEGAVGTAVSVTLTGTGFLASPTVTATDGVTVTVTATTPTLISATFTIPAGASRDALADVTVTNTDGGFVTLADAFHLFGKSDAPTIGAATPGNSMATVTWTAPAFDGGSAITGYTVTASPGGATASAGPGATTVVVPGLTNGTSYTFTVRAMNAAGDSAESAASGAVTPRTVPGAPAAPTATPGNGKATVSWTAPVDNGGNAVTGYTVTASPGGASASTTTATTVDVAGLTNGTAYTFTVRAMNAAGDSAESAASGAVTPRTVPGAPAAPTATPGNGKAMVSWTAPADNGGNAVTGYTVTASPGGATASTTTATTVDVTGLTNGTAYTFTVRATNGAGTGAASAASSPVTPRTVPGAPTGVAAVAGDRSATVSWTAPADNGGAAVTGYTVTASPGGATTPALASATSVTVAGLTNGTAYTFTVTATNTAGGSFASAASSPVTPATVPGAPTGVSAVGGNAQATVSWTAPTDNGGSAITEYTVTSSPGGFAKTVAGDQSQAVVTGLTNGSTYTFTVVASNAKGNSAASAGSAPVSLATVPDAPSNVTATSGDGQATVTWSAPASNGGATVTKYVVAASPGTVSVTVTGSPAPTTAAVTGLTNGTAYTFTVVAHNSQGASAASAPSTARTPASTPTAPQAVAATAGDGTVTVTWSAPTSTGGAAISNYRVTLNGGTPVVLADTARAVTLTGLTNGTSYTASVVAQNGRGDSPAAAAAPVTPKFVVSGTIARSASVVTYGGTVTLSGRLTRSDGTPLAGATVKLYAKTYPATSYRLAVTLTTNSSGVWVARGRPTRTGTYYAVFAGDGADRARTTSVVGVAVRFKVALVSPTSGSTVRAGTVSVKAKVAPGIAGAAGALLLVRSDGSVVTLARATVSSAGDLVLPRRFAKGTYRLRIKVSGTKGLATGTTSVFTLRVT